MTSSPGKRTAFNPKALAEFLLICLGLGLLIAMHSRTIDAIWASLWLGFLVATSVVIVWRRVRRPDEFKRRGMGQMAVLPRRWQKWMLGEDDSDSFR